jgi:hypothetical protein
MIEGSYVSQVVKLYRTKQASDFNILFPLLNASGRLLVVMYTISKSEVILAVGFLFGLGIRFVLLGQVLYYQKRESSPHPEAFGLLDFLGIRERWHTLALQSRRWATETFSWGRRPLVAFKMVPASIHQGNVCYVEPCEHMKSKEDEVGWWVHLQDTIAQGTTFINPENTKRTNPSEEQLKAAMCQPESCTSREPVASPLISPTYCKAD